MPSRSHSCNLQLHLTQVQLLSFEDDPISSTLEAPDNSKEKDNPIWSTEDTLSEVTTYTRDNSRENTSLGRNVARQFDRTHSQERDKAPMNRRQIQDSANVSYRTFDLNKDPLFGHDMLEHLKSDAQRFLALYFSTGKTNTPDDKW
ncbi:hypothetical protein PIB30_023180 [Stylosanthes scabra]|uniref:Uncharacterized protein n=1 Tax=Stylosanthes scabra TaxID=79078 RepID=A0ABU6U9W2_9FABA|nr:hypothetical protein [Stylosanthes scabra]